METEFPPNSDKSKRPEPEEKKVEQVTTSPAIRRKRGLGKRFRDIFLGGDAKTALQHGYYEVVVPSAKEMIVDFGRDTLERLVFGQSRRQRSAPPSGPAGYTNYTRYAPSQHPPRPQRGMSPRGRGQHDFDEIVLETRQEAEDVIDRLYDLVGNYGSASVADLYAMVGIQSTHTDVKWGWEDLRGAGVSRVRGGYLLDLPNPEPLAA